MSMWIPQRLRTPLSRFLVGLVAATTVAVLVNSSFPLAERIAVSEHGSQGVLWLLAGPAMAFGAALLAVPLGLALGIPRPTRRTGLAIAVYAAVYVLVGNHFIRRGHDVRTAAFRDLARRSAPLVEAIRSFDADHGRPPATLAELVPAYLPRVPRTGMGAYPEYEYTAGEEAGSYDGNPWVLLVDTPSGGINFDVFLYFPNGVYPERGYGGRLERIEDWAYCHE